MYNKDKVQNEDKYSYKVLIDSQEFQSEVLDFIDSQEFDTLFRSSMFNTCNEHENKKNKGAIIHGMMLASMLTSRCKPLCVKEKIEEWYAMDACFKPMLLALVVFIGIILIFASMLADIAGK